MKTKNKLWLLSIIFASALAGLTGCSGNNTNDDGEWYGVGIDVNLGSRTNFLVGEKPRASMFSFTAYDDGDEVEVDPADVKIEPSRSLRAEDKQLTFKWRKYSTTLDINVSNTLVSECEQMGDAPVRYNEVEHTLNENGTEPDPTSDDPKVNVVDSRTATVATKKNIDGSITSYLSDVSYGSSFSYDFDTDNEGDEIYLFASVASNSYCWGNVSSKYATGVRGSYKIDLADVMQISNNGKNIETKKAANIKETMVTEADLDEEKDLSTTTLRWFAVVNRAMRNFERRWLGKVTLEKGMNNIKIDLNQEKVSGGRYAYQGLACGNWDKIELRYVKKGEKLKNETLKFSSYPKQEYLVGEKFSLDGAYMYLEDSTGLTNDVDMSKVKISNTKALTPSDTSIELTYNNVIVSLPILVKSKITSDLTSPDSVIKYVEPVHDRNKKNEVVGADSNDVDTRAAKNNTSLDGTRFIENASAYGKFQYAYESSEAKGKFDIYANVASSKYISGDVSTVWPGAKNGFLGSQAIDFTQFLTLKNNDKEFEVSKNAKIPETRLTSDMDPAIIKQEEAIKTSAWGACTYFLLNNFRRIHIGTVDIAQGTNNIEIDIGYNKGQFGYAGSGCGNWQSIEVIYIDDNTDKTVKTIEMTSAPTKLQYKPGEKFDITGAEFVGYNADGIEVGVINNDDIEIVNNQQLFVDGKVTLKYQQATYDVDVSVNNVITQKLNSLNNMVIQYHDQTDESDTRRAGIVTAKGGYLEKVSSGSYFEYVIEADHEVTISISAEIASNGYVYKRGDYKDYNTGIEGFTQSWIGSYDLDMSRIVKLTNTINGETKSFETNKDAIAYGHMINAADDLEASKNYDLTTAKGQWSMADDLCMRQFKNIELGEIKLSKGINTIRISMEGYLKENSFAYGGYACGNWKSISITFK